MGVILIKTIKEIYFTIHYFDLSICFISLSQGIDLLPGESIKRPAFEKILLPEYQGNDVENCLILSPICQIMFSNLPCFNRSFLPVEIGDFL